MPSGRPPQQMGSAIHSQTPLRLRRPLRETGFLDHRFDRHLIKLFHPNPTSKRVRTVFGLPLRLPARHRVTSIPTKTTRRFDCLKPAKIEDPQIACNTSAVAPSCRFSARLPARRACILGLQTHKHGDGVMPAPSTAAMVGWTTGADYWRSCGTRRAIARLALGVRHGSIANSKARVKPLWTNRLVWFRSGLRLSMPLRLISDMDGSRLGC